MFAKMHAVVSKLIENLSTPWPKEVYMRKCAQCKKEKPCNAVGGHGNLWWECDECLKARVECAPR